jgi:chromosome segregation ATPase
MNIREQIEERKNQIVAMEQRKSAAADRIQELETERRKLIVPARAGNNQAAQQRIANIDEEMAAARRDIADDEKAIADLTAELEPLRSQSAVEEHKRQRDGLRKRVADAAKRAAAIRQRFDEFTREVTASIEEGASISAALRGLDAEAAELGLDRLPSLTQVNGLATNVLGRMVNAHPSLPETDVPKQLDSFAGQLAAVAERL